MSEPIHCIRCGTVVRVASDDPMGTMYYVNADGSEHVCKGSTPPTGRDEMPGVVARNIETARQSARGSRMTPESANAAICWLADDRDRLQAALDKAQRELTAFAEWDAVYGGDDLHADPKAHAQHQIARFRADLREFLDASLALISPTPTQGGTNG